MIYTDKCQIQNVTDTPQYGEETTADFLSVCREETRDRSSKGSQGNKLVFSRLYFLPPGTNIKAGDRIRTTSRRGVTITESFVVVDEVFNVGRFKPHHVEVGIV